MGSLAGVHNKEPSALGSWWKRHGRSFPRRSPSWRMLTIPSIVNLFLYDNVSLVLIASYLWNTSAINNI